MFIKEDLYTVTGTTKLYHCWTDKVTKFDSSSFYNWEQDNMPIYDLDERTHYLWEQLGYPTSSIPGVSLVVSADAPDNAIDCNKNIFRTVSAAIEALPKIINYPIVIEIANFGQLGDLILDGLIFGKNGSLEIINRNFSRQEGAVSGSTVLAYGAFPPLTSWFNQDSSVLNKYNYVSSVSKDPTFFNIPNFAPLDSFLQASCLSISAPVFSSTFDSRLSSTTGSNSKLNGYHTTAKQQNNYVRGNLIIDDYSINPYNTGASRLVWKTFELDNNAISENEISIKDASTINDFSINHLYLSNAYVASQIDPGKIYYSTNGLFYGNKLNKLVVNNCHGNIYIRNFFLDGSSYFKTDNLNGVEINNSNVVLENIISTRYRKAGFKFTNSNVVITRGCVAARIYDFDENNQRITGPISSIRDYYTLNTSSTKQNSDDAAGIVSYNSQITFSSTHNIEYNLYDPYLDSSAYPLIPLWYIFEFVNNANGMILNNSTLTGGKSVELDQTVPTNHETSIDFAHNVGYGIISNNSKISLDGKLRVIENTNGVKLNNSILEIDKFSAFFNQNIALESYNSNITYNKNLNQYFIYAGSPISHDTYTPANYFYYNGQNLYLNNSTMMPLMSSSIENQYDKIGFEPSIRAKYKDYPNINGLIENIKVDNNSKLVLIAPTISRNSNQTVYGNDLVYKKGSELLAINNSKVNIIGTKFYCTKIVGPDEYLLSRNLAGVCADRNSNIEFNGPTVIAQYGIDVLGDNNSNIIFGAKTLGEDSILDLSTVNALDPANHTAVELHATKSCLHVNNNSQLIIRNLGSYQTCWGTRSGLTSLLSSSGVDFINDYLEAYTSGGSMQFYPNPIATPGDDYDTGNVKGKESVTVNASFTSSIVNTRGLYNIQNLTNSQLQFSSSTYGGVCVRATNGSIVNVYNVNFPCGFWNPSAAYYDGTLTLDSGGACYKTFIWNIADSSQLKASFLSVSGLYPSGAGYVGPYGFWASSTSAAAYGLPSSTPDTSSLSVLDYFGTNPSSTAYSVSSATNYGPFRLYFSVNQLANALSNVSGAPGYGIIPQIYAQGYQPSGNLIASGITNPSSLYMQAWQRNSTTNIISPSGYYYGKDMVTNPYFQRVILDESAANVFANAKHCAVGKSNNARLVSIYYPYTEIDAGDSASLYGVGSLSVFDIERYS